MALFQSASLPPCLSFYLSLALSLPLLSLSFSQSFSLFFYPSSVSLFLPPLSFFLSLSNPVSSYLSLSPIPVSFSFSHSWLSSNLLLSHPGHGRWERGHKWVKSRGRLIWMGPLVFSSGHFGSEIKSVRPF